MRIAPRTCAGRLSVKLPRTVPPRRTEPTVSDASVLFSENERSACDARPASSVESTTNRQVPSGAVAASGKRYVPTAVFGPTSTGCSLPSGAMSRAFTVEGRTIL